MVVHLVLFTPRADLGETGRRDLAQALTRAVREIPSVRDARVGSRVRHGADYERDVAPQSFLVEVEFDSVDGLREYLAHPAHADLGRHFRESLESAAAYDFEVGGTEGLKGL